MANKMNFDDMNPDLANERKNAQFNLIALSNLLHGGADRVARRREIAELVESSPIYQDPKDVRFMTREERLENVARKTQALFSATTTIPTEDFTEFKHLYVLALGDDVSPFGLHFIAGMPFVQSQSDDEQFSKWGPLLFSNSINVAYAQTELGHGSNLRRLETTATYDPSSQEFIINTPTVTSTKWWAGNLGKSANYSVVMAQLITQGQNRGVHGFLVPLRDQDSHKLLPGVDLGDIGPKFGMPTNDNGYARFNNVRIPRENMLMRHAKVLLDGTYVPPVHQKLSYGSMVYIRAMMISMMAYDLERACTIAIRYGCVRRQGNDQQDGIVRNQPTKLERKVLDYQTQQYRLFPELAKAFASHFVGVHMREMYTNISQELRKGDTSNLARLHALSAGLKAVITRDAAMGIEICRLSCGGHGYSLACGIPEIYMTNVAGCTYEGDNIILLLQTARSLIKEVRSGAMVIPQPMARRNTVTLTLSELLHAYNLVAVKMAHETSDLLRNFEQRGFSAEKAWDRCTVELSRTAKASVRAFIVENYINAVNGQSSDASVRRILALLCELYAICGIQARNGDFMAYADFSKTQIRAIRGRCCDILEAIRPAAVQLVDAFEFRDRELRSVLGRYDGHVYENLFEWAKQSPLNKMEVLDTFPKYLAPIMREGRSKL